MLYACNPALGRLKSEDCGFRLALVTQQVSKKEHLGLKVNDTVLTMHKAPMFNPKYLRKTERLTTSGRRIKTCPMKPDLGLKHTSLWRLATFKHRKMISAGHGAHRTEAPPPTPTHPPPHNEVPRMTIQRNKCQTQTSPKQEKPGLQRGPGMADSHGRLGRSGHGKRDSSPGT